MRELMELILSAASGDIGDPDMGMPAHRVAVEILESYSGARTRDECKRHFVRYLAFIQRLRVARKLGDGDITAALELQKFFTALHVKALCAGHGSETEGEDDE